MMLKRTATSDFRLKVDLMQFLSMCNKNC